MNAKRYGCMGCGLLLLGFVCSPVIWLFLHDPTRPDPRTVTPERAAALFEFGGVDVVHPKALYVDSGINAIFAECESVTLEPGLFPSDKVPTLGYAPYRKGAHRFGWVRVARLPTGKFLVGMLAATESIEFDQTGEPTARKYDEILARFARR